jgi:hypothetical protein
MLTSTVAVLLIASSLDLSAAEAPMKAAAPAMAPARVQEPPAGVAADLAGEVKSVKFLRLRLDDPAAHFLLTGEVQLPSGANFALQFTAAADLNKAVKSFDMVSDAGGIRTARNNRARVFVAADAPGFNDWQRFTLRRMGEVVAFAVNDGPGEVELLSPAAQALFLYFGKGAALRNVRYGAMPVDGGRFVPVLFDDLTATPLAGPALGGAALAPESLPPTLAEIDGVPFHFGKGGLDVSTSMKELREPFRLKSAYLLDTTTKLNGRHVACVPAEEYSALHVVAFSRELPGGVPRMTARLGLFGGGSALLEDTRMEVPALRAAQPTPAAPAVAVTLADGTRGYLHRISVPLHRMGNLWDMRSTPETRRAFDLEFTRDVRTRVNIPDPNEFGQVPAGPPSAVVVLAATLERSPVEVSAASDQPGNIFNEPQKPLFRAQLLNRAARETSGRVSARCAGPGTAEETDRRDEWTVSAPYSLKPGEKIEIALDVTPPSGRRGWYSCTLTAEEGGRALQQRETSFALLAPDTRKAQADSPFGVWCFWRTHTLNLLPNEEVVERLGPILRKGGWRWTYGGTPISYALYYSKDPNAAQQRAKIYRDVQEKYGFTWTLHSPPHAYQRDTGWHDEKLFEQEVLPDLKNARESGIENVAKVLHESRSSSALIVRLSEFLGGKPYDMPVAEKEKLDKQFANVVAYCRALKKAEPGIRVVLINDYPSVGIEYMKRGMPKEAFDIFGSEGAMFMREPERQPDWLCLLGVAQIWRRARAQYGYEDKPVWTTEALYHGTNPGNLTLHGQAVRYVRDALLALANGVERLAAQGCVSDCSDDYRWSNWGSVGHTFRDPEFNPKPSYALFAWLTQVLDQARYAGRMETGSTSLHLLDFARADGAHVYPVWVVRGRQKVALSVEGAPEVYDPFGNKLALRAEGGRLSVTVTDTPIYITGGTVTGVAAREPVELARDGGRTLLDFDKPARLKTSETPSAILDAAWDYPRFKGTFKSDHVIEDGVTALRVEMLPDQDPRKLLQRYVEFVLDPPVRLEGRPRALTARVKGNGGWGRLMFELTDARGRVWNSTGNQYSGSTNSSDNKGDSYVSFDGWQTMTVSLPGQYDSPDQWVARPDQCNWWPTNAPEWIEEQGRYAKQQADFPARLADYEKRKQEYDKAMQEHEAAKQEKKRVGAPPKAPERPKELAPLKNRGLSPVDYPLTLTKVFVAMPPNVLYADTELAVKSPVIYIDRIGALEQEER